MGDTLNAWERPKKQWPSWIDDLLLWGPLAELEYEWKAAIGDAITRVLDARADSVAASSAASGEERNG